MKSFEERMENIQKKAKNIKNRRRAIAGGCAGLMVLVLALTLFLPYDSSPADVSGYKNDPYYGLIKNFNDLTYDPPQYKNNYEWLKDAIGSVKHVSDLAGFDEIIYGAGGMNFAPTSQPESATGDEQTYEEVTDNQVEGVIEGDLFKRSDKYLYYLNGSVLSVYSIDKENSTKVGSFDCGLTNAEKMTEGYRVIYHYPREMYLSQDCTTLTVLLEGYDKEKGSYTAVTNLDVTDPGNIQHKGTMYFSGNMISSRMVEGKLLLIYNFSVYKSSIDFDKPETFVPSCGTAGSMQPITADKIYCPTEPNNTRYTVVSMLDSSSLQALDHAAFLSYSQQLYISKDTIFATYGYTDRIDETDKTYTATTMTQITGVSYVGQELRLLGSVKLEGSVKDQYSMDQHEGILRVATSTSVTTREQWSDGDLWWVNMGQSKRNCNLYCVDLSDWTVAGSVIAFAPEGEEVTSARFDGNTGYVCTAEVVIMTDPVYFFDLSDVKNITYKHTPVIDGYSSSLIQFGDYLLGIGLNGEGEMKLEVYIETENGVDPVASYERPCWFTPKYKAYFIDRENNLFGIPIQDWQTGQAKYLLLHYNGVEFNVLQEIEIDYARDTVRATIVDGWLYTLAGNEFQAVQAW